jgi:carbamate kinase
MKNKVAVIAFGGNAIKKTKADDQLQQLSYADEACQIIIDIVKQNYGLIIVHGNGPQVGDILIQIENSEHEVKPFTLDVCGAMSQGSMGYMLAGAMRNQLKKNNIKKDVAVVISQAVVDKEDPMFQNPTKFIGPVFKKEYLIKPLQDKKKWVMKYYGGAEEEGWRRVVASPRPIKIIEEDVILQLIKSGSIVIAGGGGGIPVCMNEEGEIEGVEAVIDKDYTASLIARKVRADLFVILTAVDRVFLNYGKENEKPLAKISIKEAEKHLKEGQFPPGSMGPKVQAAIEFIQGGGKEVLITSAANFKDALAAKTGTRIVR